MNVIQLRDKLNFIISEGKGNYPIYDVCEDAYEIDNIDEGIIYKYDPPQFASASIRYESGNDIKCGPKEIKIIGRVVRLY